MNIKGIKQRAMQLLVNCQPQFIRILTIMMLIGLIQTLFLELPAFLGIITLGVLIAFLPFSHGYVVSSLKIVRNNYESLTDEDAWVGFKRFKELFPTYFLSALILCGIIFVFTFFLTIIFIIMLGGMLGSLSYYAGAEDILISMVRYAPMALFLLMIFVLLIIVVIYIISQFLFAVPYLLEQYHMKNGRAISESVKFMRGHMVDLFKLDISFLGWILLEVFISGLVMALLGDSIFVTLLASAASGLFSIYTYYPKYQLSRAIFFEEIAYRRYGMESVQSTIVDQDELVGE